MEGVKARRLALRILRDYYSRDAYLNVVLGSRLGKSDLDRRDRALVTELVQGTVRTLLNLDWRLEQHSDCPLDSLDEGVLWILRISAYQLCYMSVPDYAACDIAASIAREEHGRGAAGYVNAVLRSMARSDSGPSYPDPDNDPVGYLSLRYSHPDWVARMWLEEMGFKRTESLCIADNQPLPVSIRCNPTKVDRERLMADLKGQGFVVEYSELAPEGLLVKGGGEIVATKEYRDGLFAVQGQGSMLVGHVVSPIPGMNVLDLCAAPGGKANHIAELMGNRGLVLALDKNPGRLAMVEESSRRLGNTIVRTINMDATKVADYLEGEYDRVIVDAPCSGLGTLSRRPDVRWRKVPQDIERLVALQGSLLEAGAMKLAPGGTLVYSTCTISRRENQGVVESFLERQPAFTLQDLGRFVGNTKGQYTQLLPDVHHCEGVFIAAMSKGR